MASWPAGPRPAAAKAARSRPLPTAALPVRARQQLALALALAWPSRSPWLHVASSARRQSAPRVVEEVRVAVTSSTRGPPCASSRSWPLAAHRRLVRGQKEPARWSLPGAHARRAGRHPRSRADARALMAMMEAATADRRTATADGGSRQRRSPRGWCRRRPMG